MAYENAASRLQEIINISKTTAGYLVDWDGCCALGKTCLLAQEAKARVVFWRCHPKQRGRATAHATAQCVGIGRFGNGKRVKKLQEQD